VKPSYEARSGLRSGVAIAQHGLEVAALSVDILVSANSLPWHHRDPADRFIIATAQQMGAAVVTADNRFAQYGLTVLG